MSHRCIGDGARLLGESRLAEALACFAESSEPAALFGTAVCLQLLGRFEEALAAYESVLAVDSHHAEALQNLVAMSVERFDLEHVRRWSLRLLEIDPESPVALQGLVLVALERREYELAASYFSRLGDGAAWQEGAIEYRVTRERLARLRSTNGSLTHSY
ncbi:MAG: hypothetical protein ACRD30_02355 [Bryobacteraceae bacterium]